MQIFNTLSGKKEEFIPLRENHVNIYVCGPTVYNYIHLGNARPIVIFDTLRKYLKYQGYDVKYVQNFTDIDDKIINRAHEENMEPSELALKYIQEYFKDVNALGVLAADEHPRVSQNIPEIISLIQKLIDSGHAYELDGDVYYRVHSFPEYGKLSGRSLEDMQAGARIEIDERKEDPFDFALWKKAKPGEPAWISPWGEGRPGWHIECSVMSMKYLGETLDIHGGGADLIFPHHENEIAQSEAATGKPFSRYWMHNGFITVNHEKMSKSLGNFFILREILSHFSGDVIRFYLISTHYRNSLDFDDQKLIESKQALNHLKNTLHLVREYALESPDAPETGEITEITEQIEALKEQFSQAMDDDLNTANAIGSLFEMSKILNVAFIQADKKDPQIINTARKVYQIYHDLGKVLGIFIENIQEPVNYQNMAPSLTKIFSSVIQAAEAQKDTAFKELIMPFIPELHFPIMPEEGNNTFQELQSEEILKKLIDLRAFCRQNKKYAIADLIRDELKSCNLILEDTKEGVRWKFVND